MGLRTFLGLRKRYQGVGRIRQNLLKTFPKHAVCAEIGVWYGDFSTAILAETRPRLLHLIDPWKFSPEYPERLYGGRQARNQADMDCIAQYVANQFGSDERVKIHRGVSSDFFSEYEGLPLDWIYIDGDHSLESVLSDLRGAWEIVRKGGLIAGDDYNWRDADGSLSVQAAVRRFASEVGCGFDLLEHQFVFVRQ